MASKRKGRMMDAMEAFANAVAVSTSSIVKEYSEKSKKHSTHDAVFLPAALPAAASPEDLFSSMLGCIFGNDSHPKSVIKKRKRSIAATSQPPPQEQEEVFVASASSSKRKSGRNRNGRGASKLVDTTEPSIADSKRKGGRQARPPRTPQPARVEQAVAEPGSNVRRNPGRRARIDVAIEPSRGRRANASPLPIVRSDRSITAPSSAVRKGRKNSRKEPTPSPSPVIRKGRRAGNKKPAPKSSSRKKKYVEEEQQQEESDDEGLKRPLNASQHEQKSPRIEVITIEDTPQPTEKRKKTKATDGNAAEEPAKDDEKREQDENELMDSSDRDDPSEKDEDEDTEKPAAAVPQKPKRLFNPTVLAAPKPRTVRTAVAASTAGQVRRAAKTLGVKKPLRKPSLPAHGESSKHQTTNLSENDPQQASAPEKPAPSAEDHENKTSKKKPIRDDSEKENEAADTVAIDEKVEVAEDLLNLNEVQREEPDCIQKASLDEEKSPVLNDANNSRDPDREDKVIENDSPGKPESPPRKKTFTLEPLFPKSIFAANSPARPAQKTAKLKSISFAIPAESKKRKTGEAGGDADGSSKKMKSSVEGATASNDGAFSSGKSTLRAAIENMRNRNSQKSMGTPYKASETSEKLSQETPHTKSSGFYSAKSYAESSTSLETEETPCAAAEASFKFDELPTLTKHTPTRALSFSKTPVEDLEKRFDMASPDAVEASAQLNKKVSGEEDVDMTGEENDKNRNKVANIPVMNNLLTSVSSFLPSNSNIFGYPTSNRAPEESETSEEKAARIVREQKEDAERREAEMQMRREGARLARQAESKAKQRKVLEHKRKLEEERKAKEIEQKRKEDDRIKRLREDLEARKKKKAEDERKRELRQQRAREHREKIAAAENARRLEMERKANAHRQVPYKGGGASSFKGGPSSSGGVGAASSKAGRVFGTPSILKKKTKEASGPVTSYEMSAERKHSGDSDSESDPERHAAKKGKQIPEWAKKENVRRALEEQTEDPDKTFSRVQSVNLEDVFASTQQSKIRYRSRNSSGAWTKDRLTAKEEMEYKKKSGFI